MTQYAQFSPSQVSRFARIILASAVVAVLAVSFFTFSQVSFATGGSGTYTGCLKASSSTGGFFGQFYNFSDGTSPLLACASGDLEVSLGNGDITGVTAGTGLSGGSSSGSATLSVAPSYQLPQGCSTDQIIKWNGSAWVCASGVVKPIAKDAIVSGGTTYTTTAAPGSAVSLPGTTVSFSSGEIPTSSKLYITWTGRFTNNGAGNSVDTTVLVDSNAVVGTRVVVPIANQWTQHAMTRVVPVSAGAHTVEVYWNTLGGTATSADTQLSVMVIPD